MYLAIRNPGVAEPAAFTLMGASGTRGYGHGTIGQFGTGSKYSVALLLRHGIRPIVVCGNLKMEFFSKPVPLEGKMVNQVCIKYSGKDTNGDTCNKTVELGFVTQMGALDWPYVNMAVREFYSNAIDGATKSGKDYTAVEHKIVDEPRAKAGYTTVYLPYTAQIEQAYSGLSRQFLHVGRPGMLNKRLLPKLEQGKTLIYREGVLCSYIDKDSVFDYNLPNSLPIDESRNVNEYTAREYMAKALMNASVTEFGQVLDALITGKEVVEASFNKYSLTESQSPEIKAKVGEAWKRVAGSTAILSRGLATVDSFIVNKGYKPVAIVSSSWIDVLRTFGIKNESDVLDTDESDGRTVSPATADQLAAVKWAMDLARSFGMDKGKPNPEVFSFQQVMDGGSQTYGLYKDGKVYLHTELEGRVLKKVALEEVVHYITGSSDGSRDLQDFLFRLLTEIAA